MKTLSVKQAFECMDERWRWIARDNRGLVYAYTTKPIRKEVGVFVATGDGETCIIGPIRVDIKPGDIIERDPVPVAFSTLEPGDRFTIAGEMFGVHRKVHTHAFMNAIIECGHAVNVPSATMCVVVKGNAS